MKRRCRAEKTRQGDAPKGEYWWEFANGGGGSLHVFIDGSGWYQEKLGEARHRFQCQLKWAH